MAPLHGHFQSVLSLIQVNPKAGVGERSKAVTCWWTTKRHGISLSKLFSEVEHSRSIYPLKPSCPATEKAFAGQGLCWLTALHGHSRAGYSWQSKKCILSGFLASSAKHLQKMFWEGRGKKKGAPPPFYSNKNIFDLYTVYMLHKNANYSPEERRNRAILCIPPFPLHYPLYFYDAAFI